MAYEIITTYPKNKQHKIYDRNYSMCSDDAHRIARELMNKHPEALIILTSRRSYIGSMSLSEYGLSKTEMESLREWSNPHTPDDSIESIRERKYWTVERPIEGKLFGDEYYFNTGERAKKKARGLSKTYPDTKIILQAFNRCRRIYLNGEIYRDIDSFSSIFIEEDTEYFKNSSIIWSEIL